MKKLHHLWEKQAERQMTLHATAKEYSPILLLVTFGKILTMLLSITGGIFYFTSVFAHLYLPVVVFLSAMLLFLLEGLNLFSLSKALKMTMRKKLLSAVVLGCLSICLFGISFFVTTEGARQWKYEKAEQSESIAQGYANETEQTRRRYRNRIEQLQNAIAPITPYAWKSQQVARYNAQIDSLQNQMQVDIALLEQRKANAQYADKQKADKEATEFWAVGVMLMIAQLIFNVVIAILYNRIHIENQQTQRIDEELNELRKERLQNFYAQIKRDFSELEQLFLQRLAITGGTQQLAFAHSDEPSQIESEPKPETKKTTIVGFRNSARANISAQKAHTENAEPSTYVGTSAVLSDESRAKTISYLNKHKYVTCAICEVVNEENESISNAQIRQVQAKAHKAKHKSEALVRNVFFAAHSVGINDVKKIMQANTNE